MTTYTNNSSVTQKVLYKTTGKTYELGKDLTGFTDTPTESDFPWNFKLVQPGQTVDLGDTVWTQAVDFTTAPKKYGRGGAPRSNKPNDIVNTEKNIIYVCYQVAGKEYDLAGLDKDTDTQTSLPYDKVGLAPGEAFYVESGVTVVKKINAQPPL